MASGVKIAYKHRSRKKVSVEWKGSDESDEDYVVSEDDGFDVSEDEQVSFVYEDETEESLGEFEEEDVDVDVDVDGEEDFGNKKTKKVSGDRNRKSFQGRSNNGVAMPRKKKAGSSKEEERRDNYNPGGAKRRKKSNSSKNDEEGGDGDGMELWHGNSGKTSNKTQVSCPGKYAGYIEKHRKRSRVPCQEENGNDDSDYNIDEEFEPNEEELHVTTKNKVRRLKMRAAAQFANGQKRKRKTNLVRRTTRKKPQKQQVVRRCNSSYPHNELRNQNLISRKNERNDEQRWGRREKSSVNSDSATLSSGSTSNDYTISEEERQQVREAHEFCRRATSNFRNAKFSKVISKEEVAPPQTKLSGMKGKEKVEDMKIEVGNQVCGICLSEEGKRSVKGILDCCSHSFCFTCIMEWSKVESRCPLCKKRFATVSRTAVVNGICDSRNVVVIPIPKRDQVYQPSEEELRSYLDPYGNLLCNECQQGGDDALMLLCDLCDSPAHTYCVGLGHEVPEGNWYCDGCKPTAVDSSNVQALNPASDHGANCNLDVISPPGASVQETSNLNELHVSDTPLSGNSVFGSQIGQDGIMTPQRAVNSARTEQQNIHHRGRLPNYSSSLVNCREVFSPSSSSLREHTLDNAASSSTNHLIGGLTRNEFIGINLGSGLTSLQFHRGPDTCLSPCQFRDVSHSPREKELVQSLVRSQLKSLARNFEIGYSTFKDIARTSTHTVLAAIGVEHRWNKVYPVRIHPLSCEHFESRHTCPIGGQCASCFDWFVKNVVREIVYTRVSPPPIA